MILIASALLAFTLPVPPPPEVTAAGHAYSDCVEQLWPQAEAGVRPADAADSILDYCRPRLAAWVSLSLRWLDSGKGAGPSPEATREHAAERRMMLRMGRTERARLIRLITRARRQNRDD